MYVLILEEPRAESTMLRFLAVNTENKTARDVTNVFIQGIKAVKELSNGTIWARGEYIYGMKYNNWVRGIRSLFGPMTPEREAVILKSCGDLIPRESLLRMLAYEPIMMG